ncbi:ribosome 60S biogenesis N-terminal-domain-containing protein [Fimicolochytrium jonesii]|uniref:ribosome 60S biogenesis N-terminal-domain-containing protein n=1 Tax=Fimicolochytrium jonesii TaxID=1396493 RepID=UPI0022FDC9CF|nr:ribosome 60S biogenesis N-terminal-domain-containing protein [Fimicolochytrium jonesii]KAI8826758.1 ribosome 60S biogenesis N-terminal-domain-containing protein [Fimicolochytrium jonesii]
MSPPAEHLSHANLVTALNSDNVETLLSGLTAFDRSLARLVYEEVDSEVSNDAELLKAYLKQSPEATELFRIWSFQQENALDRIGSVIVDVIARIIEGSKLVELYPSGLFIARRVVREYMKQLYRGLSSGKNSMMQSTLRLFVAVARFNPSTSKELVENFNFTMNAIPKLLSTRQKSQSSKSHRAEDVRSLYVKYLLALLEHGDGTTKKFLMETKNLLSSIFKGLPEDDIELVRTVTETLRRTVVDDATVPRTVKIAFFNNYVLEQLSRLYGRTDVDESSSTCIADVGHAFLLHLCSNPGVGVCFQDAGWYPAKSNTGAKSIRVYNKVLLKFLVALRPTEDVRQQDLVLAVLKSCPELVHPYWNELASLSMDPRPSTKWLANMALAAKVISLPVPPIFGANEVGSLPPPVDTVAQNILPSQLDRSVNSRALQHPNSMIKHTVAVVLGLAFAKLAAVQSMVGDIVRTITSSSTQVSFAFGNVDELLSAWAKFSSDLIEDVRRRAPDLQIVLAMQHQQLKQGGDTTTAPQPSPTNAEIDGTEDVLEEISTEVLHCAALRLIQQYQRQFPDAIIEARVNYGKFLPADLTTCSPDLQLHLLRLIGEVPEFNWKERAPNASGSHLYTILRLFLVTDVPEVRDAATNVITRILSDSLLFQHHVDEIPIWLDTLQSNPPERRDAILSWIDEAFCTGSRTPYRLVDRMSQLIQSADSQMDETEKRVADHILATRKRTFNAPYDDLQLPYFPFSPALMCVTDGLQALLRRNVENESAQAEASMKFFTALVVDVVHGTQGTSRYALSLVGTIEGKKVPLEVLASYLEGFLSGKRGESAQTLLTSEGRSSPRLTDLFSFSGTHTEQATERYVEALKIYGDTRKWLEWTRHTFLEVGRVVRLKDEAKISLCFRVLEAIVSTARPGNVGPTSAVLTAPITGKLAASEEYARIRDVIFGHPYLTDNYVGTSPQAKFLSPAVVDLVHRSMTAESEANFNANSTSPVWTSYCDTIRDLLLSELSTTTISQTSVTLFKSFRQFMPPQSLNTILQHLLTNPTSPDDLLYLALTARSGTAEQIITPDFFRKLIAMIPTASNAEVERVVLKIIYDGVLPLPLAMERRTGEVSWALFKVRGEREGAGADVTALFDGESVRFLLKGLSGESGDTRAEILQVLVAYNPSWRDWVATQFAKKDVVDRLSEVAVLRLYAGLMSGFTVRSRSNARDALDTVDWISSMAKKHKMTVQALHARAAPLIRECLLEGSLGGCHRLNILDTDILFRSASLFGKGDGETPLLDELLSQAIAQTQPKDQARATTWLAEHLNVLLAFENAHKQGSIVGTLLLCFWNTRCFIGRKKKQIDLDADDERALGALLRLMRDRVSGALDGLKVDQRAWMTLVEHKALVKHFVVSALKFRMGDCRVLEILALLVGVLYAGHAGSEVSSFSTEELCDMITSHSQYTMILHLPVESDTAATGIQKTRPFSIPNPAKATLLDLLFTIMSQDPSRCCKPEYLPALAQAYGGSTAPADRNVLKIWKLYEVDAGLSIDPYAFHWGQAVTNSLSGLSAAESITRIDPVWMAHTCQWFVADENVEVSRSDGSSGDRVFSSRHSPSYDWKFFLPLVAAILAQHHTSVDPRQLVESNVIGLAVMALSSLNDSTRRAGYFILDYAYEVLFNAEIKERNQVILVLDGLRNAIINRADLLNEAKPGETQRIPGIVTLFVAQGLMVLLKPENEMFPLINRFFLQRPIMDLEDVPMFYDLFYSSTTNCRKERVWMLRLLCCGLESAADYRCYKRRHVLDILMSFFTSSMADTMLRKLVLEFIFRATAIPSVISDMITQSGLLTFLQNAVGGWDFHNVSNDIALGFPRLLRAILQGFLRSDPEWHGGRRSLWLEGIATVTVALIQCVTRAAKGNVDAKTAPIYGELLLSIGCLVNDLARAFVEEAARFPGRVIVSPISAGHVVTLIGVFEESICFVPTATSKKSTVGDEDDSLLTELSLDLDKLYATTSGTVHRVFARVRLELFAAACATPVPFESQTTLESLLGFCLSTVDREPQIWDIGNKVSSKTPRVDDFLKFLLRLYRGSQKQSTEAISSLNEALRSGLERFVTLAGLSGNTDVSASRRVLCNAGLALSRKQERILLGKRKRDDDAPPTDRAPTPRKSKKNGKASVPTTSTIKQRLDSVLEKYLPQAPSPKDLANNAGVTATIDAKRDEVIGLALRCDRMGGGISEEVLAGLE